MCFEAVPFAGLARLPILPVSEACLSGRFKTSSHCCCRASQAFKAVENRGSGRNSSANSHRFGREHIPVSLCRLRTLFVCLCHFCDVFKVCFFFSFLLALFFWKLKRQRFCRPTTLEDCLSPARRTSRQVF